MENVGVTYLSVHALVDLFSSVAYKPRYDPPFPSLSLSNFSTVALSPLPLAILHGRGFSHNATLLFFHSVASALHRWWEKISLGKTARYVGGGISSHLSFLFTLFFSLFMSPVINKKWKCWGGDFVYISICWHFLHPKKLKSRSCR